MSLTKVSYSMIRSAPVNVLDYGAVGNGTADDTIPLQNAVNASSGNTLILPKGYIFRHTADIVLISDLTIDGEGTLCADYNQTLAHGSLYALGAASSPVLLTTDVNNISSAGVAVANNSGFALNDMVEIGQTSVATYPVVYAIVTGLTGGTGIAVEIPIGVTFLVSDGAYIKKIFPVENITIRNISITQTSAATYTYNFIYGKYCKNVRVESIQTSNQYGQTASAIQFENCLGVNVLNNKVRSGVLSTDVTYQAEGGAGIISSCSDVLISGNASQVYAFGWGIYLCAGGRIVSNSATSANEGTTFHTGVRAYKIYACMYVVCSDNESIGFETGVKLDFSSYGVISGNTLRNNKSHSINLNNCSNNSISGNVIFSSQGSGIYVGVTSSYNSITGNSIYQSSECGILSEGNSNVISSNLVIGFVVSGVNTAQLNNIVSNYIYTADNTAPSISVTGGYQPANASTIIGNIAGNNSVDSADAAAFTSFVFAGNNLKGVQDRVFYNSIMPTTMAWTIGDLVLNTTTPTGGVVRGWKRMTSNGNNVLNTDWISIGVY